MATAPTGEPLADWTPSGGTAGLRVYGTNAHHDVTWLARSDGTVQESLRYDPWGSPRVTPTTTYTPFRFQGSWYDTAADLAWVVTRWYAPAQGRFISEDSLLGEPREPDSRHLYAYAAGDPIAGWDPDGRDQAWTNFNFTVQKGGKGTRTWEVWAPRIWHMYTHTERQQEAVLDATATVFGIADTSYTTDAGWKLGIHFDWLTASSSTTTYVGAGISEGWISVDVFRKRSSDETHVGASPYQWIGGKQVLYFFSATCCAIGPYSYTVSVSQWRGVMNKVIRQPFQTCLRGSVGTTCRTHERNAIYRNDALRIRTTIHSKSVSYLWAPTDTEWLLRNYKLTLKRG